MNRLDAIALALMLAGVPAVAAQFSSNPEDWDRYHDHQDACWTYDDTLRQCSGVASGCDQVLVDALQRQCSAYNYYRRGFAV